MKIHKRVLGVSSVAALSTVLVAACGPSDAPRTGVQTNWLKSCQSDAQCGDLECLCGACSLPCDSSDTACSGLSGGSCVPSDDSGTIALCGGSPPLMAGICLQRCEVGECSDGTTCVEGVCVPTREADAIISIDSEVRFQTLVGFGAAVAYTTEEIAQHPDRDALFDAMFVDSGLDILRIRNRYNDAGGGDLSSTETIVNAATDRLGDTPTLFLSSWSPPGALKADGSSQCSGNPQSCTLATLGDGSFDYDGFATHWLDSLQAYSDLGIEPDYIGIQNDPDYVPPASDVMEACRFLPTEGTATVSVNGEDVEVDYPGFEEALAAVRDALSNLPSAPKILAPETVGVVSTVTYLMGLDLQGVDAIAHHMYGADPNDPMDRDAMVAIGEIGAENDLPIFQTEMMAEGLDTAILMQEALTTIGVSAYLQNDLVASSMLTTPDLTALIGLTEMGFNLQDPYYAMIHFARDTDPGWVRVSTEADAGDVLSTAWLSPDEDALTVVLVNPAVTDTVVQLDFGDLDPSDSSVTRTVFPGVERSVDLGELAADAIVTLPGESIVTVAVGL